MRYSILLASSLAVGAFARPHLEKRVTRYRIFTETAIETVTIVITITLDANLPTPLGSTPIISVDATPTSSSTSVSSSQSFPGGLAAPGGASITSFSTSSSTVSSTIVSSSSSSSTLVGLPIGSVISSATSSTASSVSSDLVSSSSPAVAPSSTAPFTPVFNVGPTHTTGTGQALLTSGTEYMNAILYHHNYARANHGASQLTWCTDCENNARLTAQTCNFAHYLPTGVNEGQNLFTVSGDVFNVTAGITESWYKAELPFMNGYYNLPQIPDDVFHQVGHFTQVVWKGTTSVGCVSMDCGANMMVNGQTSNLNKFTVCNYSPPGNVDGTYDTNVQMPSSTSAAALGSWDM